MQDVIHTDVSSEGGPAASYLATKTQTSDYLDYWCVQAPEGIQNPRLVRYRRRQYEELRWVEEPIISRPPQQEPEDIILVESGILPLLLTQAEQEPPSANWRRDLADL